MVFMPGANGTTACQLVYPSVVEAAILLTCTMETPLRSSVAVPRTRILASSVIETGVGNAIVIVGAVVSPDGKELLGVLLVALPPLPLPPPQPDVKINSDASIHGRDLWVKFVILLLS